MGSIGLLAPYADLALLVGPRYTRHVRLLSTDSQYAASMVLVARAVFAGDLDLTAPAPVAAVAAVPAAPAGGRGASGRGGGGRGRGGGAGAPAVPAVPAAPLPSSSDDEDVRLGVSEWLHTHALPLELGAVPRNKRDARLEIQARVRFAETTQREAASLSCCFQRQRSAQSSMAFLSPRSLDSLVGLPLSCWTTLTWQT